jgi:ABC-2 type transport system permease protein
MTTHQTQAIQCRPGLFTGQPVGADIWVALDWCVCLLVVAYVFAMRTYRRKIS